MAIVLLKWDFQTLGTAWETHLPSVLYYWTSPPVIVVLLLFTCRYAPYPNLYPDQSPSEEWTMEERFRPLTFHGLILRSQLVNLLIRGVCYTENQSVGHIRTHKHAHINTPTHIYVRVISVTNFSMFNWIFIHTIHYRVPLSPGCPMQRWLRITHVTLTSMTWILPCSTPAW